MSKLYSKIHWDITKCKTDDNVEFWIVDYFKESDIPTDMTFSFLDKDIFDFRNDETNKCKFFRTKGEAIRFRDNLLLENV